MRISPTLNKSRRAARGGVAVEGAIGIGLVVLAVIVSTFFLIHVWQMIIYKQKIATAASEAAQYAADVASLASYQDSFARADNLANLQALSALKVQSTLQILGINPANSNVTIALDGRILIVTVNCTQLPVIGGGLIPDQVSMSEVGSAPVRIIMPPALVTITSSSGNSFTVNAYGNPPNLTNFPNPYEQISISLPAGLTFHSQTLNTIIDPHWLDWSPVYPN
jgi:hypothetical protein